MLTRRTVIAALVAAPLLVRARRASAGPAAGEVYRGRPVWDDARRVRAAHVVPLAGGGCAVLGARFRDARHPHVFSIANDNSRYTAWLDIGRQRKPRELFLILPDGTAAYASSNWSATEPCEIGFEVSADHAAILAERWGVETKDRVALDRDLVMHWQAHTAVQDHAQVLIELVVENRGTFAVVVWTSPQVNDNFRFTATENGTALPARGPFGSRGPMGLRSIEPGASATFTGDLAQAVVLTRGGVYEV